MLTEIANLYMDLGIEHPLDNEPQNLKNAAGQVSNFNELRFHDNNSRSLASKCVNLNQLKQAVMQFDGCELKKISTKTVFGDGSESAKLMFIGEAPGANEDKMGIPFCGQSGKLLNNILLSIGLSRPDVYITNTVYWRPPGNRRPTPSEIEMCRPFVEKHIALIKPKLIILVGSTAVESLLGTNVAMHNLRGSVHKYINQYLDEPIMTTLIFHPSYLLRQPYKKKLMWHDMLAVKELTKV